MLNNKFLFEFKKKKNPKIYGFSHSRSKKYYSYYISLKFIFFIYLKKLLPYSIGKLLTSTF